MKGMKAERGGGEQKCIALRMIFLFILAEEECSYVPTIKPSLVVETKVKLANEK